VNQSRGREARRGLNVVTVSRPVVPVRWQRAARGRGEIKLGHRLEDGQHLVFTHDQVLVAVYLDLLARVLAE
jgi:hypothetical protein